jgi:ABC-type transport system involved in multi-copper enzyme maturation permease subunit
MWNRIWSLQQRALRMDVHGWFGHLGRVLSVGTLYATLVMMLYSANFLLLGAPGLQWFSTVGVCNVVLIALAGISYFSTAISEELEEDTLGLMLLTGLSPLTILLGKSTSRLVQAVLLVVLQLPGAMLAITMGGITLSQVLAMYVMLLSFLFLVANLALLCSVLASSNRQASIFMLILSVLYTLIYAFSYVWTANGVLTQFCTALRGVMIFDRIGNIYTTGFGFRLVTRFEVAQVAMGLLAFLTAWLTFRKMSFTAGMTSGTPLFGWLRPGSLFGLWGRSRRSRVWAPPVVWKDFHTTAGSWEWFALRLIGYGLIFLVCIAFQASSIGFTPRNRFMWDQAIVASLVFVNFAVTLDAANLFARLLADERQQQTWTTLLLTNSTLPQLLRWKWLALLIGMVPGLTWQFLLLFGTRTGLESIVYPNYDEPMLWALTVCFVAGISWAGLWALFVRWGAVALGGLTAVVLGMVFGFCCFEVLDVRSEDDFGTMLFCFGALQFVATQIAIYCRLHVLGTT